MQMTLDHAPCAYLGDAYLYMFAILRGATADAETEAPRWVATGLPKGDPLRAADAAHFGAPQSPLIFEPRSKGGVGAPAFAPFLEAGVVCVGHCCRQVSGPQGGGRPEWMTSYTEAQSRNPRLPKKVGAAGEWASLIEWLCREQVEPTRPEVVPPADEGWARGRINEAPQPMTRAQHTAVDAEEVRHAAALMELERAHMREGKPRRSTESWEKVLRRCFRGVEALPAGEWAHGGRDRSKVARGAHVVLALAGDGSASAHGGEAGWLQRAGVDAAGRAGDWRVKADRICAALDLDEECYVCCALTHCRLSIEEARAIGPAVECKGGHVYAVCRGGRYGDPVASAATRGAQVKSLLGEGHVCRRGQV